MGEEMSELEKLKQQNEVMRKALIKINYSPHYGMTDGMMVGYANDALNECREISRKYYQSNVRRLTNEFK